jgi:hypothetical protein
MDTRSQLDEYPPNVANAARPDREERLLRLVDILRTEQMRAAVIETEEVSKKRFPRWRSIGLFLAIAVIVIGTAAALLRVADPFHVHPGSPPGPPARLAPVQPALNPDRSGKSDVSPGVSPSQPHEAVTETEPAPNLQVAPGSNGEALGAQASSNRPSLAAAPERTAADPPNVAEPTAPPAARPNPVGSPGPEHRADTVASPQSPGVAQATSESQTARPVLRVYYPKGSIRAEVNAWSLSVRSGSSFAGSDFMLQTNGSSDAVVKFSGERNHAVARLVGKYLGDAGYSWKIENTTGSADAQRNIIEVWLPMK